MYLELKRVTCLAILLWYLELKRVTCLAILELSCNTKEENMDSTDFALDQIVSSFLNEFLSIGFGFFSLIKWFKFNRSFTEKYYSLLCNFLKEIFSTYKEFHVKLSDVERTDNLLEIFYCKRTQRIFKTQKARRNFMFIWNVVGGLEKAISTSMTVMQFLPIKIFSTHKKLSAVSSSKWIVSFIFQITLN